MTKYLKYASGSLLGALIADAAGATLEFLGHKPTSNELSHALTLPGGGALGTAPAQITDDGELTLALCHALMNQPTYPLQRVAQHYRRWLLSRPFDVGSTTHNALGQGDLHSPTLADEMIARSKELNSASQANGSLMRASALGVWAARVSLDQAVKAALLDAQLTHPNLVCQWSAAAYVVAIRSLMLAPGKAEQAFTAAMAVVQASNDEGAQMVGQWLHQAKGDTLPKCTPMQGHVRIAFIHAFHHLLRATPYVEAIRSTMAGGGDTDTNACIVGGLIGALHGRAGIREDMVQSLLNCDTALGHLRPAWLQTRGLDLVIERLVGLSK